MMTDLMPEFAPHEWQQLAEEVLARAKKIGASQAEVSLGVNQGLSVSVRQGAPEQVDFERDQGLSLTLYHGQRKGLVSSTDLSIEAIDKSLAAAWAIAQYTDHDPCAGLADVTLLAHHFPDLDIYHPWALAAEQAIDLALQTEAAAFAVDKRISNSEGAAVSSQASCLVYANSLGFNQATLSTQHQISCSMVAEVAGSMQRDYSYMAATDYRDLHSPAVIGQEAAARTVRRLGARRLKTQQAPVIFAADMARGLMGHLMAAISGGALYRKASFLVDALGQTILPEFVSIYERPYLLKGLGSASFDSEGVATREQAFIDHGRLVNYVLGSYTARQLGMATTANADGVHNLFVSSSGSSLTDLFKAMGTGLYVTELIGQGINLINGDYSRGAAGFWIENGEIAYPVEEITIAGNLRDLYQNIVAIANDIDLRGNIKTGSIWIKQMTIGGE